MQVTETLNHETSNDISTDEMLLIGGVRSSSVVNDPTPKLLNDLTAGETSRPNTRSGEIVSTFKENETINHDIPMLSEESEEMITPKDRLEHTLGPEKEKLPRKKDPL